jgi:FkbM family methyltransferase
MPDIFENAEGLKFSRKLVNGKYEVLVPSFMDVHDWWGNWETARFASMDKWLKPGMLLYEIGAFDGWQSAILARFVGGGENMVLVEPVAENWVNIKATWEANGIAEPKESYCGLIGPNNPNLADTEDLLVPKVYMGWPKGPDYSKLIAVTKFKHISENTHNTPTLPLDFLIMEAPAAINIDVEGAELIVLKSGEFTLRNQSPLVWLSVHPEFMRERYGHEPEQIEKFMRSLGYAAEFLGTDHEQHWLWRKS